MFTLILCYIFSDSLNWGATVVDDVVDVLPTADTLDKKVLLTTDNKIYKTVKEKEINSAYSITGNLTIDSKGNISGFNETNYLTLTSQYWPQFFPVKLRVVFNIDTNDVPFLQMYRNDNNSLLFSLSLRNYSSSSSQFSAKVYDNGNVIETQSFNYDKAIDNISGVFEIRMTMNRIYISKEGTFITSLFLSKLNSSLIPYNVAGTLKLSNIISGGYSKGIYYIDGLNSSICSGSFIKQENKLAIDTSVSNYVWQEYLTCQKGSKIINQQKSNMCYYDGTQWQNITGYPEEITDLISTSQVFDNNEKLKTNANYNFGELLYLTFHYGSINSSPLLTSIRFLSGATATILSDNTVDVINWVDGVPTPSPNKNCLIFIWNKLGFYKEW